MDKENFCYSKALSIYNYYYNLARKEFKQSVAERLAKIPADYVYSNLMMNYPQCYLNETCCLKYCNDILDTEFDKFDPEFKREIYNKSFNVQSTVSDYEISSGLRSKRRSFKNLFNDAIRRERVDLNNLLENMTIKEQPRNLKRRGSGQLENVLKNLKIN